MTDVELFPYIVRDRKWRNAYLGIMAEKLTKGESIADLIDFENEKKKEQRLQKVLKEFKESK